MTEFDNQKIMKAGIEYFYHAANLQRSFLSLAHLIKAELRPRLITKQIVVQEQQNEDGVLDHISKACSNVFTSLFGPV